MFVCLLVCLFEALLYFSPPWVFVSLSPQDFFLNVKDILRKPEDTSPSAHNYHELEKDLQEKWATISFPLFYFALIFVISCTVLILQICCRFMEKKAAVHDALCGMSCSYLWLSCMLRNISLSFHLFLHSFFHYVFLLFFVVRTCFLR